MTLSTPSTPSLNITAADLVEVVNPLRDPAGFRYGNDPGVMSEDSVIKLLTSEEETMLSRLPETYMTVIRGHIDGVFLSDRHYGARDGQTAFILPLAPVDADTVRIFINYNLRAKPWRSRTYQDALSAGDYTLDADTGDLVLATALAEGDKVIAEYNHTSAGMIGPVKNLVLKAARLELYTRLPNWSPDSQILSDLREQIDGEVLSYYGDDGSARGINIIDRLELVIENRQSTRHTVKMPFLGGW